MPRYIIPIQLIIDCPETHPIDSIVNTVCAAVVKRCSELEEVEVQSCPATYHTYQAHQQAAPAP